MPRASASIRQAFLGRGSAPKWEHSQAGDIRQPLDISRLLKLFEHGVPVFANAIDKAGYSFIQSMPSNTNLFQDISPYMATFSQCLREADNYIHTESPKEKLLWISDDAAIHEADLKDALRSIREVQRMNFKDKYPALEFPEPRLSNITDTIYFGASKNSRALQRRCPESC
jgi:hypothetical protein